MNIPNDDSLELFFAGCDEETMEKLIRLYEDGNKAGLMEYVKSLADKEMKDRLLSGFGELRGMEEED